MGLKQQIEPLCQRVDATLAAHFENLSDSSQPQRLLEAMRYSLFNGGKRLRPVLTYASCLALGGKLAQADRAAAAVECIHAYSLVHDDLPAMDDDELRRGQPTCHIAFDEATAILAGDALQPLAFEMISMDPSLAPEIRLQMVQTLARASGDQGMVGGQALDIAAEGQRQTLEQLQRMHSLKTGALIRAAVQLGALASNRSSEGDRAALDAYACAIGLAFQVQDDILDIEGDTQTLGKPQGSDLAHDKSTYPALLGLDGAKQKAAELHRQALNALTHLPHETTLLRQVADYIVARDH